jgi:CRISPR-associated endonuclease/helicase Cas3
MERLYVDRAYTDREMAERLRVDRTTVFRDRLTLEAEIPFVDEGRGRWRIDRRRYLSAIRLNVSEALALYLAARRASRQTSHADPHVVSALEKLASVLRQPMTERLVVAAGRLMERTSRPDRDEVVEAVTRSWTERRQLRMLYRSLHAGRTSWHLVSPYLIEPALWSDGAYVIGYSSELQREATFKIQRIERAELTSVRFEVPEEFDEQVLLRYAWGIWYDDVEPTTVRLQFAPGPAAQRLSESLWHPTQRIEELPDGGCIWEAEVAAWQELLPWVRGWGADVEVLTPPELRERVAAEARAVAGRYGHPTEM